MGKWFENFSAGSALTVIVIFFVIVFGDSSFVDRLFLYDVMPSFGIYGRENAVSAESVPANASVFQIGNAYIEEVPAKEIEKINVADIKDLNTLRQKMYSVDKKTGMTEDVFDIDKMLNTDVHITPSLTEPKILIFHTHAHELYADSKDKSEGVVGAGEYLAEIMEKKYGVKCLHITDSFDEVNGSTSITGAYERMEPVITKALKDNPSIEMVIDLHRDGVGEGVRLVSNIDGKPTAKVMFFNGLCKKYENGRLTDIADLENKYIATNVALSFKMQLKANELYPDLTRKIYLNAYRYSLHMMDKSMLIELGAQTNTEEEVKNAVEKLAEVLNDTVIE